MGVGKKKKKKMKKMKKIARGCWLVRGPKKKVMLVYNFAICLYNMLVRATISLSTLRTERISGLV
jgi:hypothetical protein